MQDGSKVAIKQLDQASKQGEQEFRVEVDVLSCLHSPYLLALIGYCAEHDHRLLVDEFMPNGSLQEHLYSDGKVVVDGMVEHKFDMKPHTKNIDDYRRLCRERTNKSNFKARQVLVIDNDHGGYNPMQGMMDFSTILSKDKKGSAAAVKIQEMKRTTMDRGELENIIFKLFEQQSNWTLKQLVTETDQPQQFIKEILNDLGLYNKRGTNQGTYELNPEYKKSTEDMDAE